MEFIIRKTSGISYEKPLENAFIGLRSGIERNSQIFKRW